MKQLFILIGILVFLSPSITSAKTVQLDFCARGIGQTLMQTALVSVSTQGPDLGEDLARVVTEASKRLLWAGKATEVFVEPIKVGDVTTRQLCPAQRDISISLDITQSDLDRLNLERNRSSPGESPTIRELANRTRKVRNPSEESLKKDPDEKPFCTVRIFYATNRGLTGETSVDNRYGPRRGKGLVVGITDVTIPKSHEMGELETPSIWKLEWKLDPRKHMSLASVQVQDRKVWNQSVKRRATALGNPGVLLFIHGYNVTFPDAAIRTAQLTYDLAFPGAAVFFSWPSQGSVVAYPADEQAAEWSVPQMKELLKQLSSLGANVPIYVVAHSMGNRILTRAFKNLLDEDLTKRRAFKELILTAPDIDAEVFKTQIAPSILGVGPHVTLYASSQDQALVASRKFHGGYERLGESEPTVTILPDLDTIDASRIRTDFLGHSYFGDSSSVMSDLFYLIREGMKPHERFALERLSSPAGDYWRFKK